MEITAEIRFINETEEENKENTAGKVADSLAPDNTEHIRTIPDGSGVRITLRSGKINSVLAAADDLLMNADTAIRTLKKSSVKRHEAGDDGTGNGGKAENDNI